MIQPEDIGGPVGEALAAWPPWAAGAVTLLGAVVVGSLLLELVLGLVLFAARRTEFDGDEHMVRRLRMPVRLAVPLLIVLLMRPALGLPQEADELLRRLLAIGLIGVATWLVIRILNAAVMVVLRRHRTDVADNLEARRIHTQLRVVSRIVSIVAGVVGVAAALMTFPSIRQLGASLLASAGVAGIILGLAAQRTIGNFLAGIQIALAGTVRLDDVVVVDGHWGRIEEITSTYVVVRIWDERRLIVPLSRIIEQPFENWTRKTADILGTVYVRADYTVPVEAARAEVRRLAERSKHWDGRVAGLVVTDTDEHGVQLRALVSARDASNGWDLRCEVREGLVAFLQREHRGSLPKVRAMVERAGREHRGTGSDAREHLVPQGIGAAPGGA
ncbi:MAG: mechanosensitive ion channel family protein [Phycisphaerales bacterium]|nr:mechanosensitive ion channel family protein [Phycisphaerales bacterium]